MRWFLTILFFLLGMSASALAEDVRVGIEPGPPLTNPDGTGLVIDMLRSIEKVSDLRFHVTVMPYNRAVKELKSGRRDLIFPTRYHGESAEFNSFADELQWSISSAVDIYSMKPITNLDHLREKNRRIGVPRGTETACSDKTGIPMQNIIGGELEGLLQMMKAGRIDAVTFARSPTMSAVQKLSLGTVYYRKLFQGPGGFGVRRDAAGKKLKAKLEPLLAQIDNAIFAAFSVYNQLPESGTVPKTIQ